MASKLFQVEDGMYLMFSDKELMFKTWFAENGYVLLDIFVFVMVFDSYSLFFWQQ